MNFFNIKVKNRKGFTLIELLVVISIIGLLSTLAVVSLNNARAKARDARRVSDLKAVSTALEVYRDDHNDKVVDIKANWTDTIESINSGDNIYLPAGAPVDPDVLRIKTAVDNQKSYTYCVDSDMRYYLLYASLEVAPPGRGINGEIENYTIADCVNAAGRVEALPTCDGDVNFCLGRL